MSTVIFGFHAIGELLKKESLRGTLYLLSGKKKNEELRLLARDRDVPVVLGDAAELDAVSHRADHRGAVLVLDEIPLAYRDNLSFLLKSLASPQALVILLDQVTDPHNLGAVLRTADQFGADCVVVTERHSAQQTPTVTKTSSGASAFVATVTVPNLRQAIEMLKQHEFWIYGAEVTGTDAHRLDLSGRVALVMGSEGRGLRPLVRQACDGFVRIPARGHVDSFNVSVAAGILMYEVRRQQGFPGGK